MSNPVDELLERPIPAEVWHYTSIAGLEGILSSGTVWATDARYTNDKKEIIHARDVAEECLRSLKADARHDQLPVDTLCDMLAKAFDEGALSPMETEVYLVSFSEAADLISQWVQYADGGRGVSIAFDLRYIRPPKEAEIAVTFAPCVYDDATKLSLIQFVLDQFINAEVAAYERTQDPGWMPGQVRSWAIVQKIFKKPFDIKALERKLEGDVVAELKQAWRMALYDLLRVASHCKDKSFYAENEWRLVLPRTKKRPLVYQTIEYRGSKANIPYLRSNLFRKDCLPVTRVMTGPLCSGIEDVERIVKASGCAIPIVSSSAPLRDTRTL